MKIKQFQIVYEGKEGEGFGILALTECGQLFYQSCQNLTWQNLSEQLGKDQE